MVQAQLLRDAVASHFDDPVEMALVYDEATEAEAAPFFWNQLRADEARLAEMDALRTGRDRLPEPGESMARSAARRPTGLCSARCSRSSTAWRCPQEVMARPEVQARLAHDPDGAAAAAARARPRGVCCACVGSCVSWRSRLCV